MIATWVLLFRSELLSPPVDLIWVHSCKLGHFFLPLVLVAIVARTPDNADEVGGESGEGLLVEDAPILIRVGEVGGRQIILEDDEE